MWLKVYKTYRGGRSNFDYIEVDDYDKPEIQEEMSRDWAENTSGGSNYGWTVYREEIDRPPLEWINKEILSCYDGISNLEDKIEELKDLEDKIEELKDLEDKIEELYKNDKHS